MTIVVEDGTARSDSESYCSVAYATTYHAARGNADWAALAGDPIREQHLRKATDWMIEQYRNRWKGRRVLITQALDWPRVGVILEDFGGSQGRNAFGSYGLFQVSFQVVPDQVARACSEMALRSINGLLAADLDRPTTSERVGPIAVTYGINARQTIKYQAVDNLLAPYLFYNDTVVKIQRA